MRTAIAFLVLLALVVTAGPASSSPGAADRWLVSNCACTAGGFGSPEAHNWYIQLGVFTDRDRADAFEEAATARGLRAWTFGAGWLNTGNAIADGPWVVVSRPYPTRRAAVRALRRYRAFASDAMVGKYMTCPGEGD